jgi:hypothetical protein
MKMPEPIMAPATSIVASKSPSFRWNAPVDADSLMAIPFRVGFVLERVTDSPRNGNG